jgi:alpha-tubulin suppressor-like RCC1 family protein
MVSAGEAFSCGVNSAGAAKCWGGNLTGQLGNGNMTNQSSAAQVVGLTGGIVSVSAGSKHACAVTVAGPVKCWGYNSYGQLGDGTNITRTAPVEVQGLTAIKAVAVHGTNSACALTAAGGVKCWGWNIHGELGDGTTESRTAPVDVIGLTSGVRHIAAGVDHTCAVTTTGAVKCWGQNDYGELGDGSTDTSTVPADVVNAASGFQAVAAGIEHTCALTTAGAVYCWGQNLWGQLGDGSTVERHAPINVAALGVGVQAIAAGGRHTCALMKTGQLYCWGRNEDGESGQPNSTDDELSPAVVMNVPAGVTGVACGRSHTCLALGSGAVRCFGSNSSGERGDTSALFKAEPTSDVPGF